MTQPPETTADMLRIDVADKKYTVIQSKDGRLTALRYGEPWRDLTGDGLVLALAYSIDRLQAEVANERETSATLGKFIKRMTKECFALKTERDQFSTELDKHKKAYLDIADATARETFGADDVCNKIRAIRDERDQFRTEIAALRKERDNYLAINEKFKMALRMPGHGNYVEYAAEIRTKVDNLTAANATLHAQAQAERERAEKAEALLFTTKDVADLKQIVAERDQARARVVALEKAFARIASLRSSGFSQEEMAFKAICIAERAILPPASSEPARIPCKFCGL